MTSSLKAKYHILAILTVAVWGTTFISTKILINNGLSPQEIFLLRFIIAYIGIWFISLHIPADTRSAFPVISVQSPVSIQCCWQS